MHCQNKIGMVIQDKKIAIIGGGPGGLTLARLLQLKGANVKVYERDVNATVRIQGGALDLHAESGLAALAKAGLMEEFKLNYRPGAELVRVVDSQCVIHADEHTIGSTGKFGDEHYRPEIDRGPLRDILLNSLQPGTVIWDRHFENLEPLGDQWKITFKNGDSAIADIVIGADGANSKIRHFVTEIKPFWTGITMLEGSIKDSQNTAPNIHELLKGGKIFAFGNGKTLIVSSKGDGSFGFAASFKSNEFWVRESGIDFNNHREVLSWFKKEFLEWDKVWWELFAHETTVFIPRPQYCMPLDQKWAAKPNLTLLGDAAHWMPPFAGEGVNMAMLDALQLSEVLTNPGFQDTRTAIAHYEKQMLARFAKVGRSTLFNTKWMHGPNALKDMCTMFSKNIFKQSWFLGKMWFYVRFVPAIRKAIRLKPN